MFDANLYFGTNLTFLLVGSGSSAKGGRSKQINKQRRGPQPQPGPKHWQPQPEANKPGPSLSPKQASPSLSLKQAWPQPRPQTSLASASASNKPGLSLSLKEAWPQPQPLPQRGASAFSAKRGPQPQPQVQRGGQPRPLAQMGAAAAISRKDQPSLKQQWGAGPSLRRKGRQFQPEALRGAPASACPQVYLSSLLVNALLDHSFHRSHFGSRYKLGCCGNASLFAQVQFPAPLHFWHLPKNDTCGIRTHAGRPHRLSRPTP